MSKVAKNTDLVDELAELAGRFSSIKSGSASNYANLSGDEKRNTQTKDLIECWTDALGLIIYDLQDRRRAPIEVIGMLNELVGELANLHAGTMSRLRDLPQESGGKRSIQRIHVQALVAFIIDMAIKLDFPLKEAASLVVDQLRLFGLDALGDRPHSETPEWRRLVNLRKKIRRTPSGDPVRDVYDYFISKYGQEPPAEAIRAALTGLTSFASKSPDTQLPGSAPDN